jgi:hypothetical protein
VAGQGWARCQAASGAAGKSTYDAGLTEVPSMTAIPLVLELARFDREPEGRSRLRCPACNEVLMLHQPDEKLPARLLGTCTGCQAWFLIHAGAGIMLRLPEGQVLSDPKATSIGRAESSPQGPSPAGPGTPRRPRGRRG